MTGQADVNNDLAKEESDITLDKFNQLVDVVANIKQSVDNSNDALAVYLRNQEEKENNKLTAQKQELVSKIIAKSKEFSEEELLKLDLNYLEKLEKAIVPVEEPEQNQGFGSARIVDEAGKDTEKIELSRDDIKAWLRLKMGFKAEAPKHIQAKVRARLNGEVYDGSESFIQYLVEKNKENR
jgi:hypothetical protein